MTDDNLALLIPFTIVAGVIIVGAATHILLGSKEIRTNLPTRFFDLFNRHSSKGLVFCYQYNFYRGYGKESAVPRMPNFRWYLKRLARKYNDHYAAIRSTYKRQYIPVVDADSEHDVVLAEMWLLENKIDYAVIESSNHKYWILLNKPCRRSRSAIGIAQAVPGNDREYVSFCEYHGFTYIRAAMKDHRYIVPRIVKYSQSALVNEFADKIIEHFSTEEVKWLYRFRAFKEGKIDLADKNQITSSLTIDEVLKWIRVG